MIRKNTWFLIIISIFLCNILKGQYISSSAHGNDTIFYPTRNQEVPVYVFNAPEDGTISGILTAHGPVETTEYDFIWEKYDNSTATFNSIYSSNGVISIKDDLDEGGYRIIISEAGVDIDTLHAWIFINDFDVAILNKNENGELQRSDRDCFHFFLDAEAYLDSLIYYDIYDNSQYVLNAEIEEIVWETDTEDEEFTGITQESLKPNVSSSLVEDAEIRLVVTDKYGSVQRDTIQYIPIMVRAKFSHEFTYVTSLGQQLDQDKDEFYKKYYRDSTQLSAPQEVEFINESSSKVDSVTWRFDDDTISYNKDSSILHTYYRSGTYSPTLIVENSQTGCIDSIKKDDLIEIPAAEFEMPNAFLIKEGNVFRCLDVSVTYIEIIIFTRWGQKVHEYAGDIRNWAGWDGRIKGSDRYAKTGVYYYIMNALDGWETSEKRMDYNKDVKTGFFYVFNDL